MEDNLTLPQVAKKLERYIMTLPAAKQFNTLSVAPRKVMMDLSDSAYNLRSNVERYFFADDSEEQKLFIETAIMHAKKLNEQILQASGYDLLGPADVAQLDALAETIRERLE